MNKKQAWTGILGMGRTGRALKAFFQENVVCFDQNPTGDDVPDQITSWDDRIQTLIVSPGVALDHPLIQHANANNVHCISELDAAYAHLDLPLVAVTGSLGKSTLCKLIFELLSSSNKKVFLGGNYGTPLIEATRDAYDLAVVEVSSFQLAHSCVFSPHVGVFLNFSPNHLNWHKTLDAYFDAKKSLFARQTPQDVAVLNFDHPDIRNIKPASNVMSFGHDQGLDALIKDGVFYLQGEATPIVSTNVPSEQVMVLLLLCAYFDLSLQTLQKVLDDFEPLPHRQEHFVHGGVTYINDSKSTTPDATLFAIENTNQPLHLILCGEDKDTDLVCFSSELATNKHIQSITLFGDIAHTLASMIDRKNVTVVDDMKSALQHVHSINEKKHVVLFSPGFASFDQYANMQVRGEAFKSLVQTL